MKRALLPILIAFVVAACAGKKGTASRTEEGSAKPANNLSDPGAVLRFLTADGDSLLERGILRNAAPPAFALQMRIREPYRNNMFRKLLHRKDLACMQRQLAEPAWTWPEEMSVPTDSAQGIRYAISRPVYGRDGRIMLLSIERLRDLRVQRGWGIALIQENGTWRSHRLGTWVH